MIYVNGKEIRRQVQNGPQKDALEMAEVVLGMPIGVSDRTFRVSFRPHYIFSDECPRDKEITTLILPAYFSPKAYFFFGDHKQLTPIIFSTFQDRKYKSRMSNKSGDDEEPGGVENLGEDGPEKEEAAQAQWKCKDQWEHSLDRHKLPGEQPGSIILQQHARQLYLGQPP